MNRRILLINYEFPPVGGGGGVASRDIAEGCVELGYTVDVVTTHFGQLPVQETVGGMNIYRVRVPFRRYQTHASMLSLFLFPVCALGTALGLIVRHRYNFVHSHFVVPSAVLGRWIARIARLPHVISIHGGDIYDPSKKSSPHRFLLLRWYIRRLLQSAAHVVAQSSNTKENAQRFYGCTRDIVCIPLPCVVPNVLQKSRKELGLYDERIYAVGIGRLVQRKGFDDAIRAVAQMKQRIDMLLIGDGPERQRLQDLAQNLGVADRVHILGYVEDERKYQLLQNADMYILSSWHEGYSISTVEAMYCGLPVIATNQGGQTDFLVHEDNALLVSPQCPNDLAAAMDRCITDEAFRRHAAIYNAQKSRELSRISIAQRYVALTLSE